MRKIYAIVGLISVICILLSVAIQIEKNGYEHNSPVSGLCSITPGSQCETVQTSVYGSTFGVSNPYYGIIGFSLILIASVILLFKKSKLCQWIIEAGSVISGAVALRFLYIQAFVLGQYCILCVIVDSFSLVLLGMTIYLIIKYR